VTEKEFWLRLEFRICAEIAALADDDFRGWWCDGFIRERMGLVGDRPAIIGRVWMCRGRDQFPWHFALLLRNAIENIDDVDWQSLLPPPDVTGWLSLNRLRKEAKIDLQAAYPDLKVD
jgi:hypothetical protein